MSKLVSAVLLAINAIFATSAWGQEHVHTPTDSTPDTAPAPAAGHEHHHVQPAAPDSPSHESHAASAESSAPTQSELEHVAPEPPASELPDMSFRAMADMMTMDDRAPVGKVLIEQLDGRLSDGSAVVAWDALAWYGGDYNKLWFRTEGEHSGSTTEEARAELLWDRVFSRWWSSQVGLRHDFGEGSPRNWLALGVQGLAPYFFDVAATAYVGDAGRIAARFEARYEVLFTQRLVLEPQFEVNAYGKDDPENDVMAGFSDLQFALRLRYEFRREFAPYLGVVWIRRLGETADLVQSRGDDPSEVQALAGVRFWF